MTREDDMNEVDKINIESKESGNEGSSAENFARLLLLLFSDKGKYSLSSDMTCLVRNSFGSVNILYLQVLGDNSGESIGNFTEMFIKARGFSQNYTGIMYRFVHVADDFEKYREQLMPVLRSCRQKCLEARIICEFDILDMKTGKYFNAEGGKIRDRETAGIYREAIEKYASLPDALETEVSNLNAKKKETIRANRVRPVGIWANFSGIIILINILLFFTDELLKQNGGRNLTDILAQSNRAVAEGEIWRIVSSAFIHADISHIAGNMLMLFFLGYIILKHYNPAEFLLIYMGGGIFGNILTFFLMPRDIISMGASGAVMALGGALIYRMFFGRYKNDFRRPAYYVMVAIQVLYNLFLGLFNPVINNFGHFGGFFAGFAIAWGIFKIKNVKEKRKNEL